MIFGDKKETVNFSQQQEFVLVLHPCICSGTDRCICDFFKATPETNLEQL